MTVQTIRPRIPAGARTLLLLAMVFWAHSALAATWTVNPGCSTNGNGTSASCATAAGGAGAWKNLDSVVCGTGGARPGDTIELKGGTYGRWQFQQTCSGTSSSRYIVQNVAGEAVLFDGAKDIHTSTWTSVGNGVYRCTGGTCGTSQNFPFTAWYQRGNNAEQRLNLIQTDRTCDSSLPAGFMKYAAGQVCVHLSDGSNPANATYFKIPMDYMGINLSQPGTGPHYVTFRKNPAGGSFTIQRFLVYGIGLRADNVGITFDGLDVGWVMDRCLDSTNTVTGQTAASHVVRNCNVHHCGQEGIRIQADKGSWIIENNNVHDIQTYPLFDLCSGVGSGCLPGFTDQGTGIRAAVSANGLIRGNVIHDSGGGNAGRFLAIDMENGCENDMIENNLIYNTHVAGASTPNYGKALVVSGQGNFAGCTMRNNRAWNSDNCINISADALVTTGPMSFENNTCAEMHGAGIEQESNVGSWTGTINFTNNLFVNTTTVPSLALVYVNGNQSGYTVPTYSSYYCPICPAGSALIKWKGTTYKRPGDCTPGTNCVADFNAKSAYGNPNVDENGTPPSLMLTTCAGTACDAGTSIGGFTVDYRGDARPAGAAWDIGAHEFDGASGPAPPVLIDVNPMP